MTAQEAVQQVAQIPTERLAEWIAIAMSSTVVGVWVPLVIFAIALVMFVIALKKASKHVRLVDAICDEHGRVSLDRLLRAAAFICSFWVLQTVVYAYPNSLEVVFATFLCTWAALDGAKSIWGKQKPPPPPHSQQEDQQP